MAKYNNADSENYKLMAKYNKIITTAITQTTNMLM